MAPPPKVRREEECPPGFDHWPLDTFTEDEMAYLTPERIEEWREEAQFQHDRYQRDGTGIGTVLALTQARLLHTLDELRALRDTVGCSTVERSEAAPALHRWRSEPMHGADATGPKGNTKGTRSRLVTPRSCHRAGRRRP
jgi:hypothetical protein